MIQLNFRVETRPNGARVKIRDGSNDRLFGPCVADEAILWDALQEALAQKEAIENVYRSLVEDVETKDTEAAPKRGPGRPRKETGNA